MVNINLGTSNHYSQDYIYVCEFSDGLSCSRHLCTLCTVFSLSNGLMNAGRAHFHGTKVRVTGFRLARGMCPVMATGE